MSALYVGPDRVAGLEDSVDEPESKSLCQSNIQRTVMVTHLLHGLSEMEIGAARERPRILLQYLLEYSVEIVFCDRCGARVPPNAQNATCPNCGTESAHATPEIPVPTATTAPAAPVATGDIKFYFCETCGKRITDRQILDGLGRDKKLKGIYCSTCAVGVSTMEFDALVEPDPRKPIQKSSSPKIVPIDSKPVKHSSRTHLTPAKSASASTRPAWHSNSSTQSGHKSLAGPAAVVVAVILAGALFLVFRSNPEKPAPKEVITVTPPLEVTTPLPVPREVASPSPPPREAVPPIPPPLQKVEPPVPLPQVTREPEPAHQPLQPNQTLQPPRAGMNMNGLMLWLNADAGITVENGKVSAWQDSSGHNLCAIQTKVAERPTLIANALHGSHAIHFDGVNNNLVIRSIPDAQKNFTLLFTLRPVGLKNYNQSLGPGWGHFRFHAMPDGSLYAGPSESSRLKPQDGLKAGTLVNDVWNHFTLVYEQDTLTLYRNGEKLASKKLPPMSLNNFLLGVPDSNTIYGDVSELCLYDRALSEPELQALEKLMLHEGP